MISIIVPIFNSEKYLSNCIESIINQTYKELEIILVNDGSTDNSGEICNYYMGIDSRIRVIDKKNGGVSSARNIGLKEATGKYIGFVDADDMLLPDMYDNLIRRIEETEADLVICSYYTVKNNSMKKHVIDNIGTFDLKNGSSEIVYLYENYFFNALWNKIFIRSFITFQFIEECTMGEDLLFVLNYINKCRNVSILDKCLYKYFLRKNSATNTFQCDRISTVINLFDNICKLTENILDEESLRKVYKINLKKIDMAFLNLVSSHLDKNSKKKMLFDWCKNESLNNFISRYGDMGKKKYKMINSYDINNVYKYYKRKAILNKLIRK